MVFFSKLTAFHKRREVGRQASLLDQTSEPAACVQRGFLESSKSISVIQQAPMYSELVYILSLPLPLAFFIWSLFFFSLKLHSVESTMQSAQIKCLHNTSEGTLNQDSQFWLITIFPYPLYLILGNFRQKAKHLISKDKNWIQKPISLLCVLHPGCPRTCTSDKQEEKSKTNMFGRVCVCVFLTVSTCFLSTISPTFTVICVVFLIIGWCCG